MSERIARDTPEPAGSEHVGHDITATNDNLDSFRLALTLDDFKKIDTNQNDKLSALELRRISDSNELPAGKQAAVDGFLSSLDKLPARTLDYNHEVQRVIPNWNNADFAASKLSSLEFDVLDKDKDRLLSPSELASAKNDNSISDPGKYASALFLSLHDSKVFDDRNIVREKGVNDFTKLDPQFLGVDSRKLKESTNSKDEKLSMAALLETARRADFSTPESFSELIPKIQLKQSALRANKDIEIASDGTLAISKSTLSTERRVQISGEVTDALAGLNDQVQSRRDLSVKLYQSEGKRNESAKWIDSALQKSDAMSKKIGTADGASSIAELAMKQLNVAAREQLPYLTSNSQAKHFAESFDKVRDLTQQPIEVRRDLAAMSIGWDGNSDKLTIDKSNPSFLPDKAERLANEAKQLWKEINRMDPSDLTSAHQVSIFGGSWKDLDPKGKFNFYQDKNLDGKIDLFQDIRRKNFQNAR
jgi:hypothetical protein